MRDSWIFQENLESFLEMLTYIDGCKFEDWDFDAILAGIEGTDDEKDRWFCYKFEGKKRIVAFRVADLPGSSVYRFQIDVAQDAVLLIDLAFFVAEGNTMVRHNSFGKSPFVQ